MRVGVDVDGELLATPVVPGSFPDYRSIVASEPGRDPVDAAGLPALLPLELRSVGLVVRDGSVHVAPSDDAGLADVFVDPEFLHEALAVAGPRPTLVLDGPLRPLAIRGDGAGFSVLMPVAPRARAGERPRPPVPQLHPPAAVARVRQRRLHAVPVLPRRGAPTPTPCRPCCPRRARHTAFANPSGNPDPSATRARCTRPRTCDCAACHEAAEAITRREHPLAVLDWWGCRPLT